MNINARLSQWCSGLKVRLMFDGHGYCVLSDP